MNKSKLAKIQKTKRIKKLIFILVVLISVVIIIQFAAENRKADVKEQYKTEEVITESKDTDEENNNETVSEEDNLYSDAYNTFFQGDYKGAVTKADIVISKYPESFKGYTIRGIAKAFAGSFEEGMNDIDKALEINPHYGYGRYNKALNYELYGHYDEALLWYDKALEIENYMWTYYGIASIYGRRGDTANAVKYLNEAVKEESAEGGKSAIKEDAKTENDFDPVRNKKEFQDFINS